MILKWSIQNVCLFNVMHLKLNKLYYSGTRESIYYYTCLYIKLILICNNVKISQNVPMY